LATATATDAPVEATALGGDPVTEEITADAASADEAADQPEGEAGEGEKVVPEAYELTVSDGFELDAAAIEAATPVFQELGLSNDQAQKLIPIAEQFAQSITDRLNQQIIGAVTAERAAWLEEAKSDAEIGGDKWDGTLVTAAKALDTLGFTKGSPFRNLLNESGLGNHPEMIRAFAKVGRALSEDNDFIRSGQVATGARTAAETLYPSKS
jgi:hypothetical protein